MGLFEKIFGSKKETQAAADAFFRTLTAYQPVFTTWGGSVYETLQVRAAINATAMHMSKMDIQIRGTARPSLRNKLKAAPNEFQTWSQFLYRLTTILEVNNTAFIVPVIDEYDETTGVFPVLPNRCEFVQFRGQPFLRYTFGDGQKATIELDRCGIMTKFQYRSDFTGESNAAMDQTMALIDLQNQGISEGVKSAATYRFMARLANFSKEEDLAAERKRFTKLNLSRESENTGLLLFPGTYSDVKQIESKPFVIDADQMKAIDQNVFNYFGVNEKILQNSATAEDLDAFYNGKLEPLAIQLGSVMTKMLYSMRERANGTEVLITSNRLQYMSVKDKISLLQTMGDRGMLTINEGRSLLNYAPIDGGDELMPIRGEYYNAKEKEDEDGTEGT